MMNSIDRKMLKWISLPVFLILFLNRVEWFRTFEDRSFESTLIEKLISDKEVKINEIIPKGDLVCFFPQYSNPGSVKSLSKTQKDSLDFRISYSIFGSNDSIWRIAVLSEEEVLDIYRMTNFVMPNLKGGRCVRQKNSKLIFSEKSRQIVYFDLSEGD